MEINTTKAGQDYTVSFDDGAWYRLMLDPSRSIVMIYTKTDVVGGYHLARFDGVLNRDTIRRFFDTVPCSHSWVAGGLTSDWICDECGERRDL